MVRLRNKNTKLSMELYEASMEIGDLISDLNEAEEELIISRNKGKKLKYKLLNELSENKTLRQDLHSLQHSASNDFLIHLQEKNERLIEENDFLNEKNSILYKYYEEKRQELRKMKKKGNKVSIFGAYN